MNVEFSNIASSTAFTIALQNSPEAKNWLMSKMEGYISENNRYTLKIMLDPWGTDKEKDFCWGVYHNKVDEYNEIVGEQFLVINGGLIYRGLDEDGKWKYSSHT